ncbi:MAG: response regulator transcription factor [Proteobacteria bacterium]|nr:MAG: response regulator transcription factor [Pseudomonadota bacterium]
MNVLIVEDSPAIARALRDATQEAGYAPHLETDGRAAFFRAQAENFDLILLDRMLPGMEGLDVCRQLRERGVKSLILFITARDTQEDKVAGLDAGADDYLVKPFQVGELLARMRALLRRQGSGSGQPTLQVADLSLDPATRLAKRGSKTLRLSATEYSLLDYLMRHAGQTITRSQILEHVWQYDFGGSDNVLDCYISYLRQKIDKEASPKLIHTARGVGFRLGVE